MKRRRKALFLPLLIAAILLGSLILPASGASNAMLLSVNDTVMELQANNLPMVSGGTIYVPYTMFSPSVTGINLGVRAQYNASQGVLTVTDGRYPISFDVRGNTAVSSSGRPLTVRALVRNSTPYLPIEWLCSYYPILSYTLTATPYGTLIRVTNGAEVLTDEEFVDAAESLLRLNYQRYLALAPTVTPSPSPSPTPSVPVQPSTPPALVYLAFRHGEDTRQIADTLERYGQRALFLFTCKELAEQSELVLSLAAQGHQVGLVLSGSDSALCLAEFTSGRELLAQIARCPLLIVSAPDLDESGLEDLRQVGCAVWSPTIAGDRLTAGALLSRLSTSAPNFVQLNCSREEQAAVNSLIHTFAGGSTDAYHLRQVFAPLL
ncbi:MAG: hypothetical protein PUB51_06235 [Oscillospiraceae bacterium]|nr:hypothetical protein [Oscillospiraceae bacterium]